MQFLIPDLNDGKRWFRVLDTALTEPHDIVESGQESFLKNQKSYLVDAQSTLVLVGK
jgi:hypothetical protein